jgi:hypothetical protein
MTDDGNQYTVVVTNAYGGTTSSAATLAVVPEIAASDNFTGTTGAAWSSHWTNEGTGTTQIHTNRGRYKTATAMWSYLNTTNVENSDQLAVVLLEQNNSHIGLMSRRSDLNSDTCYCARVSFASTDKLYKSVDGVQDALVSAVISMDTCSDLSPKPPPTALRRF